jgi:hypothetical protein
LGGASVILVIRNLPSSTKKLSSPRSWTCTGLPSPRREIVGQGKGPAGLLGVEAHLGQDAQEQMAAWASGLEITLRVTRLIGLVMAGLLLLPGSRRRSAATFSHRELLPIDMSKADLASSTRIGPQLTQMRHHAGDVANN